jgi:hypothetical protein
MEVSVHQTISFLNEMQATNPFKIPKISDDQGQGRIQGGGGEGKGG